MLHKEGIMVEPLINSEIQRVEIKLDFIKSDITEIKIRLDKFYVTQDQFTPVRNLVYGMVGIVMISFLAGIASLIWRVAK
jgi:hypothetical protein